MIFNLLQRRCTAALTAAAALAGCCLASSVWAASSTITLAGQSDQGAYQGFYLNLENSADGDAPLTSRTLKLTLAIGDGKKWTYLTATPVWSYGHMYSVRAVISPSASTLALDGHVLANASAQVSPVDTDLIANYAPDWANPETDYWAVQDGIVVTYANLPTLTNHFTLSPSDIPALFFSARQAFRDPAFHYDGKLPLTIDVTFTLMQRPPSAVPYAPLVDQYGQAAHNAWPGKVLSDQQLIASAAQERRRLAAMPGEPGVDHYGGITWAGWRKTPTGFYRVERRHGYYWLITPTGYPCFYTGVCNAPLISGNGTPITGRWELFAKLPPKTSEYAAAYGTDMFADGNRTQYTVFDTANMIAKYGQGWRIASESLARRRLHSWGFTGFGKWSNSLPGLPYLVVLQRSGVTSPYGKPDIFDPDVRAKLASTLEQQIRPHINDPYLVGWSLGNEYDEIVSHTTVAGMLADAHPSPGKRALIDYAVQTLYGGSSSRLASAWKAAPVDVQDALYTQSLVAPAADLEALRRFFADKYYQCIYETVKSIDPHHLYLGFWIVPYWWENESDWGLIARHCDVIGYDYYADRFADNDVLRLMQQAGKPVFCGEFGYPPDYAAQRGFGLFRSWTKDDADAAQHYERWMHDASLSPYCIGGSWFEYRDEPITGRGPGHGPDVLYGEDYAFGLIDVTDRPKWDLVSGMRIANRFAAKTRLGATAILTPSRHLSRRILSRLTYGRRCPSLRGKGGEPQRDGIGSYETGCNKAQANWYTETMSERMISPDSGDEDRDEYSLRPKRLREFIGQPKIKENLGIFLQAALRRGEALDHVLLHGPPGLGKTSLSLIIANEMGAPLRATSGPAIERPGDLVAILTNLETGSILFVDEIHRLSRPVEEILYSAMEDYQVDIVIGQGPSARTIKLDVNPFTLVGATTRAGLLTSPLRDRFGIQHNFEFYTPEDLIEIIVRSAAILEVPIDLGGSQELARRSRGTPRVANRLLKRVRDFAQVRADGHITREIAGAALAMLEVDARGLDETDRRLLRTLIEKFGGGPVGVETLAAAVSEERDTIEDVYEPYLMQQGFLQRTPRGRVATRLAYEHLGIIPPGSAPGQGSLL